MPPKKKLKTNDSVDGDYDDGFKFLQSANTMLTEDVEERIENVNYFWKVHYTAAQEKDSIKLEVFVDFDGSYKFEDKVLLYVSVVIKGNETLEEFELKKDDGQIFEMNIDKKGKIIRNSDLSVEVQIQVSKGNYVADIIGTVNVFTCHDRPHDVILIVGAEKFYVYKRYLATWSKHFNELFFGNPAKKDKMEFIIKNVDADQFSSLLHIIHPSLIDYIDDYNVLYLLELGAQFKMPSLISMCGSYLSKFENIPTLGLMERLALSDQHNISHLQVACLTKYHALSDVDQLAFRDEYRDEIKNLSIDTISNFM